MRLSVLCFSGSENSSERELHIETIHREAEITTVCFKGPRGSNPLKQRLETCCTDVCVPPRGLSWHSMQLQQARDETLQSTELNPELTLSSL